MSIFKWVNDSNNDKESYEYIVKYVTKKPYTDWDTNVRTKGCRKEAIIRDMTAIKAAYHKRDGKLYEHAVLSLTPDHGTRNDSDYMEIGRRIAEHYIGFQCAYALHKDTKTRHLHFVFNSVSYKDGKKFSQGPPDLNRAKMYINTVLEEYDFDPLHSSPLEMVDTEKHYFSNGWRFLEIGNDKPDDRNLLLALPTNNETDDNSDYDVDSCFGSSWYGNRIGGYNMDLSSPYNHDLTFQRATEITPQSSHYDVPAISQATTITTEQAGKAGNGLNLVNVNNISLNSMSDLNQAVQDMGNTFSNSAMVGAEAYAALRGKGINDGVTVTTVNNYYIGSDFSIPCENDK